MSDNVHLRPKSPTSKTRLGRVPSRRSQFLSRFFDQRGDERERRISKDQLIEKGILKPEQVFGNELENLQIHPYEKVPQIVYECVSRIENMIHTVGIYRVNGDAAAVQKIRLEIDGLNYSCLETKDVSLLASTLKLFFRELPEPLINKRLRAELYGCAMERDMKKLISSIRTSVEKLSPIALSTLNYLLVHLRKVADEPQNKMDVKNIAMVFSPNLVHSVTQKRRPESIISEMELNNIIVEKLIELVDDIFTDD